ncbi:MAG: class I SAM-dependent methyltransferase [Planctomycetota bacterium]|jgi:phosphatidylethanolamine/phosphatidyl-N-methylethanolamine N-methyltransferase
MFEYSSNNRVRKFYDSLAFIYPVVDLLFTKRRRSVIYEINSLPKGKVLEIGVGIGSHLDYYKQHSITGIDLSDKMLEKAQIRRKSKDIQLIRMDGEQLDFLSDSFHYIFICRALAITGNPNRMIDEAIRVLKPSGLIYILNHDTPNSWIKYIDIAFNPVSRFFNFSSHFNVNKVQSLSRLKRVKEKSFGVCSYTKLFVFQKCPNIRSA